MHHTRQRSFGIVPRFALCCRLLPVYAFLLGIAHGQETVPTASPSPTQLPLLTPPLPGPADARLPSLFLVGDSTVRSGSGDGANGQWGWGEPLATFFDTTRINVVNRALGGRSTRTYMTQGHWDRTLALIKPGDFILIQFGHNDGSPINDAARARGTIPGTGDEITEIDNLVTKQHEVVHSFGWHLRKYVSDARSRGAKPSICSPVPRKIWKDGRVARSDEDYGKWAREVAQAEDADFINLNEIIARRYEELGEEKVEALFADEHTHTNATGAEINAAAVVMGLKALKDCALCRYLSAKGSQVPTGR